MLAGAGYVEALSYPFIGDAVLDQLGLEADDARRRTVKLVNPISDEEPALRTTLLPGLLGALRRNDGRGSHDLALFETGPGLPADRRGEAGRPAARRPPSHRRGDRRSERGPAASAAPRRRRPRGRREQSGWWGKGTPATWADAIEAARSIAAEAGVEVIVRADQHAPWHPG
ncbi:phenylalanyl-tRNA synthetase beta chain, partial [Streptomyces sp. Ncost-T6T-2b]